MKKQAYDELYKKLGIPIAPVPSNYNPETYAQELMRGCYSEQGVSYSAATAMESENTAGETTYN